MVIKIFFSIFLVIILHSLFIIPVFAIVDPLAVPNNKFGIHLIQATHDESSPAASLVNSTGGDWGYITVLIEGKDKKIDKWQAFFNDLRRRHLIPIVRLATQPSGNFWIRPDIGEASVWADFLDSLNWPVKNRYVTIYNEPNHGAEWGNSVDARSYAQILDQTITALKKKSEDFFVLNGGFDASAPQKPPTHQEEISYLQEMNNAVPGIFNKLDGWVSHSYPNPNFAGSPQASGRGTIRTYLWELELLKSLGVSKNLPVFVTETGWKHAEGINYDPALPNSDTVSDYYINAFESAWTQPQIAAVTPFLLSYQQSPFDHFSFKRVNENTPQIVAPNSQNKPSEYYPIFQAIQGLTKIAGKPIQKTEAKLTKGEIYSSIVSDQIYVINLTFKNIGQSIWGEDGNLVKLVAVEGGPQLGIEAVELPKDFIIEPNEEYTFTIKLKAPEKGSFKVALQLFTDNRPFDSNQVEFTTEVKKPVVLQILAKLKWKAQAAGEYLLKVSGAVGDSEQKLVLDNGGKSIPTEARYLLPDYEFDFTLEKPYYHPKTIHQKVGAGVNTLDFGELQPSLLFTILNPVEFWKLLPFTN